MKTYRQTGDVIGLVHTEISQQVSDGLPCTDIHAPLRMNCNKLAEFLACY